VTANHYGKRVWLPRHVATRLCDAFLCVSLTAERSFFGNSPERFSREQYGAGRRHFTIHNCVDLERVDAVLAEPLPELLRQSLGIGRRAVVGIVGRLDRFKGHDLLLAAMQIVLRSTPEVMLLCVGGGQERENLEADAKRLGIADKVILTGQKSQRDAFRHLRLMDIVVMPSRVGLEGFGLAAAEAMAMGRPLIASRADALTEVVGDDGIAGRLVTPEDVPALVTEIEYLLKNPAIRIRLGKAARSRIVNLFSVPPFEEQHLNLYQALCGWRATAIDAGRPSVGAVA
jgi:glycosyltransferase involved in cell wall biosynthesis